MEPADLDTFIDSEYVMDQWLMIDGPTASAYHLLDSLDLGSGIRVVPDFTG
jgi:hypothetical protein